MPRPLTLAIRYGCVLALYAVLIGLVLLPFAVGMEPQEFWRG